MSDFPRGYAVWRDYIDEEGHAEIRNRLLAELVDTLDEINQKLGDTNE